jgi:hypothetical protein
MIAIVTKLREFVPYAALETDSAGRLADGGSAVALPAAEESLAFAQGSYLLSSLSGIQDVALTVEEWQ